MRIVLSTLTCLVLPLTMWAAELKLPPRPADYAPNQHLTQRQQITPILDVPLRHAYVLRGPDSLYYLTGTVSHDNQGRDFQNNDGVWLWKSADLKTWEPLGQIWSLAKDAKTSAKSAWQLENRLNPDNPAGELVRGITAPEIHFLKGSWWIPYSMNGQGTGLLKSKSDKPEGPYEDVGRFTAGESSASLFENFDGAIYWVWGAGRIARMKDDLSGLAETPRTPFVELDGHYPYVPKPHDIQSVSLLKTKAKRKVEGKDIEEPSYHLLVEGGSSRLGGYTKDTFIFSSPKLQGPYAKQEMALEHGAQSTVFQDGQGAWRATFYGDDPLAVWRDKPAIVSLRYDNDRARPTHHRVIREFTTRGPWATQTPLMDDVIVNDENMLNAPDGYYYFTGSMFGDNFRKHGISVWKSKTLEPRSVKPENWREFTPVTYADIPFFAKWAEKDPSIFDFTGIPYAPVEQRPKLGTMWNAEIHYLKGTFWIVGMLWINDKNLREAAVKEGIKCPLWKSTSGKAEGPYEIHAWIGYSCPSFFQDDDGSVYLLEGVNAITRMKDDMSGYDEEWGKRMQAERGFRGVLTQKENLNMDYDIGNCLVKIGGKYVFFSCNCVGGYDYQYFVSNNILGPYSRPRVAVPHGGHAFVFKDKENKWHGLQWAGMSGMVAFLHELHVEDTGDDVIMMPKWEYEHQKKRSK